MSLRLFAPSAALRPFVDTLYIFEPAAEPGGRELNGMPSGAFEVTVPAHGGAALTVCLSDGRGAVVQSTQGHVFSGIFLTGPSTVETTVSFGARCSVLGVSFRSAACLRFLGASAVELLNMRVDYRLVAGPVAGDLESRLRDAAGDRERIRIVDSFLIRHLVQPAFAGRDWLDEAVEVILREKGKVSIDEISVRFNVSSRQLRRRFSECVGVSPKVFARMKRFGHARRLLAERPHLDLQDVIFLAGYYDQSHLLKEFRAFSVTASAPLLNCRDENCGALSTINGPTSVFYKTGSAPMG